MAARAVALGLRGGLLLGADEAGQLRLLAGRQVGVDDALGGGLVEPLGGEVVLLAQLLQRAAGRRGRNLLQLGLDRLDGGAVPQPPLLVLPQTLLGTARMRHRSTPWSVRSARFVFIRRAGGGGKGC